MQQIDDSAEFMQLLDNILAKNSTLTELVGYAFPSVNRNRERKEEKSQYRYSDSSVAQQTWQEGNDGVDYLGNYSA